MTDLTREQMLQQEAALRQFQARADDALSTWNMRAPAPAPDGTLEYADRYRRKLVRMARDHLPAKHELNIRLGNNMPMDVLANFENQIYPVCKQTGMSNDSVPSGQMRMVTRTDPHTGYKENVFLGQESFVKEFSRPCRRVVSFMHRYNSSGVAFR